MNASSGLLDNGKRVRRRRGIPVVRRISWPAQREAMRLAGAKSTSPAKNSIEITVADNGPGIPPEIRDKIFEPFFSGREAGRGLGLGLAKCWRIVTLHGGQIEVRDTPGGGATFVVRLPAQPSA
jgi:signal transduction histidine kinase